MADTVKGDTIALQSLGQFKTVSYPTEAQVEQGVTFGEGDALTGTFSGGIDVSIKVRGSNQR